MFEINHIENPSKFSTTFSGHLACGDQLGLLGGSSQDDGREHGEGSPRHLRIHLKHLSSNYFLHVWSSCLAVVCMTETCGCVALWDDCVAFWDTFFAFWDAFFFLWDGHNWVHLPKASCISLSSVVSANVTIYTTCPASPSSIFLSFQNHVFQITWQVEIKAENIIELCKSNKCKYWDRDPICFIIRPLLGITAVWRRFELSDESIFRLQWT